MESIMSLKSASSPLRNRETAEARKPSSISRLTPAGAPNPREALWCSRHAGGYSDWMDVGFSKPARRS